ncbi:hypothetical protein [Roseisolibacter sp. H3M3-2]|uniref:hypothetical protein n=1 Tax=Roseisolibacter sp. H3M3-2 TaxID=3031323 RepID=UPI0023D98A21|nr:hypothetical protein [Roseisolibacter sp. H3M3-2]MDF1505060.1 hypothetical protein [Roseisolibacter sp. H3M3-2]
MKGSATVAHTRARIVSFCGVVRRPRGPRLAPPRIPTGDAEATFQRITDDLRAVADRCRELRETSARLRADAAERRRHARTMQAENHERRARMGAMLWQLVHERMRRLGER